MSKASPAAPEADAGAAFHLKGGSFTGTLLELHSTNLDEIRAELAARTLDAAAWLRQSPVILQLDKVADRRADWAAIVGLCRDQGVSLVGARAPKALAAQLVDIGVPVLSALRSKRSGEGELEVVGERTAATAQAIAPDQPAAAAPARTSAKPARLITQPVRGGQQIYADGDLIVMAPVSAGAEVLADGHIHLYAPLRGRALAGVQGNTEARIFCQCLEAELISVAGRYRVAEELRKTPEWGRSILVSLADERLNLQAL